MRFVIAQINPTIGDFEGNLRIIGEMTARAKVRHADLVLFPELALCGYPPLDLIERAAFVDVCERALQDLLPASEGIAIVVGLVTRSDPGSLRPARNSAAFLADGKVHAVRHKCLLPTYDVFDEDRYFVPAGENTPVEWRGVRFGLTICEDLWNDRSFWARARYPVDPVERLVAQGAQIILNLSASPYHAGKAEFRADIVSTAARRHERWVLLANQVGGNDGLIFDGASLVFGPQGQLIGRAKSFEEDLLCVDIDPGHGIPQGTRIEPPLAPRAAEVLAALELGLADYLRKCGFQEALLGLSGGIDSALTAVIAARAIGAEHVTGVALPSRYSSLGSIDDARELAGNLGIKFRVVSIEPMFHATLATLEPLFADRPQDLTEENIQARLRGVILMALSNKFGALLLATGNKSESAVGYCTLYGDMCGGLAVISDLPKTTVYELALEANRQAGRDVIPASTLTKAPSAELRPEQTDQDLLPAYDILDPILEAYIEGDRSLTEMAKAGCDPEIVRKVVRMVDRSEFKRRQAAPAIRVTIKAFGLGRRLPLAQRFQED